MYLIINPSAVSMNESNSRARTSGVSLNKILLVIIAILVATITALIAGMLARLGGCSVPYAILYGGAAFGATVTLSLAILNSLGLLSGRP